MLIWSRRCLATKRLNLKNPEIGKLVVGLFLISLIRVSRVCVCVCLCVCVCGRVFERVPFGCSFCLPWMLVSLFFLIRARFLRCQGQMGATLFTLPSSSRIFGAFCLDVRISTFAN